MRCRRVEALLVAALLAVPFSACDAGHGECTAAGCDDGVVFDLSGIEALGDEALTVETCLADACRTQEVDPGNDRSAAAPMIFRTSPPGTYDPGQRLPVSAQVTGADGREVASFQDTVTLEENQPNGPHCPPTCASATVAVRT